MNQGQVQISTQQHHVHYLHNECVTRMLRCSRPLATVLDRLDLVHALEACYITYADEHCRTVSLHGLKVSRLVHPYAAC